MTMITPSYLGETIEYSSLHACRSTLEDPTALAKIVCGPKQKVQCGECHANLMRRPFRPYDGKRIERFFCDLSCKGKWQARQHPVTDEWLRERYVVDGLSAVDIAALVNRHPKGVWTWLRNAGIPTRPRGSDKRQMFKPGKPSLWKGRTHSPTSRAKISAATTGKPKIPKGKRHHWAGKTGSQHPSWKGGLTPERQAFYSSLEWKAACRAVWYRADAKCERCSLDSRSMPAKDRRFHVHHIVSFQVRESRANSDNLVLLCAPCHKFVHSKRNVENIFIVRHK